MTVNEHATIVQTVERLLRDLTISVRRQGRAVLAKFEITPAQFEALVMADNETQLTIGDLGSKLGLAYSTVTDLIDRLECQDYVVRVRDRSDKRIVRVCVLDKGRALIEEVLLARRRYLANILSLMPEEKRTAFVDVLETLGHKLHDSHANT